LFAGDDGAKLSDPLYTPIVRLGALAHRIHDDLWLQFLSGRDDCERGGSFGFFTA